jgi:hypothetical protein
MHGSRRNTTLAARRLFWGQWMAHSVSATTPDVSARHWTTLCTSSRLSTFLVLSPPSGCVIRTSSTDDSPTLLRQADAAMSGPISSLDAPPTTGEAGAVLPPGVEILQDGEARRVGAIRVRRALPRLGRRAVGAWCFADHMGPATISETSSADIGPHRTSACRPLPR